MNKEELVKKVKHTTSSLKRIFPNWILELSLVVLIFTVVFFSAGVLNTANRAEEDGLMGLNQTMQRPTTGDNGENEFQVNTTPQDQTQVIEFQTSQMCFIGDSRTVAMEGAVLTDVKFIAKSSVGLDWFENTAMSEFDNMQSSVEMCVVALGINDMHNVDEYVARLNEFAAKYPSKVFIYVNLGPIDEGKYTSTSNSAIAAFNAKMASGLSDKWQVVDQYTYLAAGGFSSEDGLHYSFQDSAKTFTWIVDTIKTQIITINAN